MKPFLRWEIDLYLNYLGEMPFDFEKVALSAQALISLQVDVTVDEFRKIAGAPQPHPDMGSGANRGAAMLYAADNPQSGDDTLPQPVALAYKNALIAMNDAKDHGKLTTEQLAAKYAALWAAAEE